MSSSPELSENALRYRVCGLRLECNVPLPELVPLSGADLCGAPDLRVRVGRMPRTRSPRLLSFYSVRHPTGEKWLSCAKDSGGFRLRFHGLADVWVNASGEEIRCAHGRQSDPATIRHLILDQVIPCALNLRGREAIHATSILTPKGVCAFVGPSGAGKSTLAASFSIAGYSVLSDDCLVLEDAPSGMLAIPAYPGIRLWDDAVEALCTSDEPAVTVAHYTSKRRVLALDTHAAFPRDPQPLSRIYVLDSWAQGKKRRLDQGRFVEEMPSQDAFMELVASAFRLDISNRAMLARQFHFAERVISQVPIRHLCYPRNFSLLGDIREAILADLG